MRQSVRKALLWQLVGLLCSLAGMVLVVVVAVGVFLAPPANSLANLTAGDAVLVATGGLLLVVGRAVGWQFGGDAGTMSEAVDAVRGRRPEQSRLEELGYHVPPEEPGDAGPEVASENGQASVRCTECGAMNEREFDYCGNCSSRLPE